MATDRPPEDLRTVPDVLAAKAEARGDAVVLEYGDRRVTAAELDDRTTALAAAFHERGVEPGDTVCLFLYNSLEYVFSYFALAKLGAVVAPIDTRFTGETLSFVLSKADAETILIDDRTREAYEAVRADVSNITTEYFVGDGAPAQPYRAFDRLLETEAAAGPEVTVSETDPLSATFVQRQASEAPKGVVLPQYSYVNTGWEVAANLFDFSASDTIFTTLPLYSIFTVQLGLMGALLGDARFVLSDPFDPDRYWELVDRYGATIILYLGRTLSVLYNQETDAAHEDNPVELAIGHGFGFGADETLIDNFEERFDITVLEGYGVTQTATIATYNTTDDRKLDSSGTPVSYADVRVVDEDDWPVPTGVTGEIVVRPTRPNSMLQGYYDDPESTVETCWNQWIHSNDIGYLDEDGHLHFVAKQDNSIYRGRIAGRISSLEIESVIDSLSGVRESAVVGVETERGNEAIKAVVVPESDTDLSPVAVCRHCEQQLPHLKVPRYIDVRADLPRNPSGKIRKAELQRIGGPEIWDRKSGYDLSR